MGEPPLLEALLDVLESGPLRGVAEHPLERAAIRAEERTGQRREVDAGFLQAPGEVLEPALEIGVGHLERLRRRARELLHGVGQAGEEELEQLLVDRQVHPPLDERRAERGPHRVALAEPHHVERAHDVHALGQRDANPVPAQEVGELDQLLVHGAGAKR